MEWSFKHTILKNWLEKRYCELRNSDLMLNTIMAIYIFAVLLAVSGLPTGISQAVSYWQLLHPCAPSKKATINADPSFVTLAPRDVQPRVQELLSLMIINLRDAYRYVNKLERSIKKALKKESSRFESVLESRNGIMKLSSPSETSTVFRSFKENLKLDYTAISKIWLYLRRFKKTGGKKKADRRWRRRMVKLKKKSLDILCQMQEVIHIEKEELPPVARLPVLRFPRDRYRRKIFEYRLLQMIKTELRKKPRLYKYYRTHLKNKPC